MKSTVHISFPSSGDQWEMAIDVLLISGDTGFDAEYSFVKAPSSSKCISVLLSSAFWKMSAATFTITAAFLSWLGVWAESLRTQVQLTIPAQ